MRDSNRSPTIPARDERRGFLEAELRARTREWIQAMVNEELDQALGIERYGRAEERLGYRKGRRARTFTTRNGCHRIDFPRGYFFAADAEGKKEWNSQLVPRYARRTDEVEDAILLSYLCGANSRRIKIALAPLLQGAALARSTISRIVKRLGTEYERWRERDWSAADIALLILDGFNLKMRLAHRVESVPVLAVLGIRPDGRKVLLALELRTCESTAAWQSLTERLCQQGVTRPVLAIIDGNGGLHNAVKTTWPWIEVQRCAVHKLQNLYTHAPKRHHEELKADYHAIVYAASEKKARLAWARFEEKWEKSCPGLVASLREAGEELLTFFRYPKMMWKCLRTTNAIERMNEEFRRRVKTQGSFPDAHAGPRLLFGLIASGQIRLRRIDGSKQLSQVLDAKRKQLGLVKTVDKAA
jgi:putative transposase